MKGSFFFFIFLLILATVQFIAIVCLFISLERTAANIPSDILRRGWGPFSTSGAAIPSMAWAPSHVAGGVRFSAMQAAGGPGHGDSGAAGIDGLPH